MPVKHKWGKLDAFSGQMSISCTKNEERDCFEHLWCWKWGGLTLLSAFTSIRFMAPELGPSRLSNLWKVTPPEADLGTFLDQFSQPLSLPVGCYWPSWGTLTECLKSPRINLGPSACARPCSFVCIGIWLPSVQAVTAHTCAVKSYPPSRYLMAVLAWEGAYQNIVIYVYEFVAQCNGSKHLCRRALKFWLARMLL